MTHSHDTPPVPDALAQVLTPDEITLLALLRQSSDPRRIFSAASTVKSNALTMRAIVDCIERLAGEVALLRQWKEDREYSDADERARLREID